MVKHPQIASDVNTNCPVDLCFIDEHSCTDKSFVHLIIQGKRMSFLINYRRYLSINNLALRILQLI